MNPLNYNNTVRLQKMNTLSLITFILPQVKSLVNSFCSVFQKSVQTPKKTEQNWMDYTNTFDPHF